jgi:hypothetical protein
MALIQKYDAAAAVKTHGLVDGTLVDIINPASPLDATGELIRMAVIGVGAWVGRGYKENKSFGF